MMRVFRAYDVRGIYPDELNETLAYKTAVATANFLKAKKLVVGADYRLSSPSLKERVISGFVDAGCDVIDIGFVPTPVFYYAIIKTNADGGIMVTASHNPPEYNGLKINGKDAYPIYAENGIYEIARMVENDQLKKSEDKGEVIRRSFVEDYIRDVALRIKIKRNLKVVVDTGNGACADIPERILKACGCEVKTIFKEPDGRFPNHIADPLKTETLKWLQREVVKEGADVGLALDGDGDRIGVVDETGNVVTQDQILMIFAKQALEHKKGNVVFEVRTSRAVIDFVERNGGKVIITKVGHAYILDEVMKRNAVFGGELSGHVYFPYCYHPFDDGIFAALKLVEFVSHLDINFSEFVDTLPKAIATPEIHIKVGDDVKFDIIERLKEVLMKKGYNINDIDGVRVDFEDGWGIVRASNTEPMIKCRFEANNEEALERIRHAVMSVLEGLIKQDE